MDNKNRKIIADMKESNKTAKIGRFQPKFLLAISFLIASKKIKKFYEFLYKQINRQSSNES